jgi:hypothetical protein
MGPVVVLGLVGAGLAAMAGNEAWATGRRCTAAPGIATDSPATTAVALALLAAWGVLLVTRGRVRRAASLLAVALAIGLVATVVLGLDAATDNLRAGQGGGLLGCAASAAAGPACGRRPAGRPAGRRSGRAAGRPATAWRRPVR